MFPVPFQYFDSRALPEMMMNFMMCGVVFGIPTLLLMFGVGCLLRKFKPGPLQLLSHLRFPSAMKVVLLAFLFGAATGIYESWTYHRDLSNDNGKWYDYFLAVPGVPGDAMANVYGGDWQDDEAWDYRSDIAILNGLFWASVAFVGVFPMRFGFRGFYRTMPPVPIAAVT